MKNKTFKDLENLFSWAQFYQNSHQLSVPRYPRRYRQEQAEGSLMKVNVMDMPHTDEVRFNNIQEEIADLREILFPEARVAFARKE